MNFYWEREKQRDGNCIDEFRLYETKLHWNIEPAAWNGNYIAMVWRYCKVKLLENRVCASDFGQNIFVNKPG